jgi:hypothetical protein
LTNESENALPMDESIWDHIEHMDVSIGIPVSENKTLDILAALEDIYYAVETDPDDARKCIVSLAAIFVASSLGKADVVWQEFAVQEAMKSLDESLKEILDEKP